MFAVQGWNVPTKSLVTEKTEPKTTRSHDADHHDLKKRKRSNGAVDRARKIDGSELEQLWNQRFGGTTGAEKGNGRRSIPGGKHPEKQKSNQIVTIETHPTAGSPLKPDADGKPQTDAEKLSRKKKKLKNKLERKDEPTDEAENEVPGPQARDHLQNKQRQDRKSAVLQPVQNQNDPDTLTRLSNSSSKPSSREVLKQPKPQPAHTSTNIIPTTQPKLTTLQASFATKLLSSRFRHLNQQLYTTPSSASLSLFTTNPSLFTAYHAGFTQSTLSWPVNPVDVFITNIRKRAIIRDDDTTRGTPLPRRKTGSCTIADLGCGDAPLARNLTSPPSFTSKQNVKIHSFDLSASNELVTTADISSLPLRDGEADICIFCLSLMGTNWIDFIEEAWRVLRGDGKGEVWVAEVKSRFGRVERQKGRVVENSVGKKRKDAVKDRRKKKGEDEGEGEEEAVFAEDIEENDDQTDISAFVKVFEKRGFRLKEDSVEKGNKMFVSVVFRKNGVPSAGKHKGLKWSGKEYVMQAQRSDVDEVDAMDEGKVLKPCVYKTR